MNDDQVCRRVLITVTLLQQNKRYFTELKSVYVTCSFSLHDAVLMLGNFESSMIVKCCFQINIHTNQLHRQTGIHSSWPQHVTDHFVFRKTKLVHYSLANLLESELLVSNTCNEWQLFAVRLKFK